VAVTARATITAATRTSARIGEEYVSDARRGPCRHQPAVIDP
jgi:hypothetical protein